MKVKIRWIRKGQEIRDIQAGKTTMYKSINAAKKASLGLQKANGGVGCGSLSILPLVYS